MDTTNTSKIAPTHKHLRDYLSELSKHGDHLPPNMVITYHAEIEVHDDTYCNGIIHHVDQQTSEPFCIIGDRARMTVPALIQLVERMGGGKVDLPLPKEDSAFVLLGHSGMRSAALADELSQAIKQLVPSTPIPKFQPAKSGHPNERTSKGSRRRNRSERWR